jgi:hypothetical protein
MEAMEFIFEFVMQFFGEILLQLFVEVLAKSLLYSFDLKSRHPIHTLYSSVGFTILGGLAGLISLTFAPHSFVTNPVLRKINLVVTPLAAGGIITLLGKRKRRSGIAPDGLDKFSYAFVFAFAMALIRFLFTQ